MSKYTPISDVDYKIDIVDHINQDHLEEILAIAQSHAPALDIATAQVEDIFEEGVHIEVSFNDRTASEVIFVPFEIEGSLEDKVLYLAYASIVKQGRDFSGTGKKFFEVIQKQNVTKNIIRLTVVSQIPLPEYFPGYAYAFVLKSMKKKAIEARNNIEKKHWLKNLFDHFFIWLMKNLSNENREKLIHGANKNVRLYTLRKSWRGSEDKCDCYYGQIDIYTHGSTPGSLWAENLRVGDVIMSRSENADKHLHLEVGQALLLADETAYPALAGILERWCNPIPPIVILISAKRDEQRYFEEVTLPAGTKVHRVTCEEHLQGESVLSVLKTLGDIDVTWGALESSAAKIVRHYLRNERQVSGKSNHTKAYWKLKE